MYPPPPPVASAPAGAVGGVIAAVGGLMAGVGAFGIYFTDKNDTQKLNNLYKQKEQLKDGLNSINNEQTKICSNEGKYKNEFINKQKSLIIDQYKFMNPEASKKDIDKFSKDLNKEWMKNGDKYFSDFKENLNKAKNEISNEIKIVEKKIEKN